MKVLNFASNSLYSQYQNRFNFQNKNAEKSLDCGVLLNNGVLNSYPLTYYLYNGQDLSFTARVDKGLERFYDVNKDIMPKTVKDYIENIPTEDRKNITPIMAQHNAYEELILAENADEVKELFPDEPLFENLKSINESRATQGLLYEIRVMRDDLENEGSSVLSTGEDFVLYLLKKVFLENKSLKQINEDLDFDLNPVFKKENKEYIHYSSFSALGIKLPKHEYLTSLRYTKEGYSDDIGGKISEGQSAFWESLTDEEKLERRKKSLSKLENWWNNLSNEDKMILLEKKDSEIKLLNAFKNDTSKALKRADDAEGQLKQTDGEQKQSKPVKTANKPKEKLETTLSNDEMFLEWARKNLEIFELGLSDEQKAELSQKRAEAQLSRWQNLLPEEKTALIEKMQSGRINQKMAMIDAWNNCSDIREHLSSFMKENNLHGLNGIIYRDGAFSEAQSRIMTAFWEKYPNDAIKLGDEIRESYAKIKESVKNDAFDDLKISILDKQAEIKKAQKHNKKNKINPATIKKTDEKTRALKEAQEEFVQYYHRMYYFMPKEFLDSYCTFAIENLKDARALKYWAGMNSGKINSDEIKYVTSKIAPIQDTPEMFRKKRAMEQAMAEVLYEASNKDAAALSLFGKQFKDLQNLMLTLETHVIFPIGIDGTNMRIIKRPDYLKLEELYEKYKKPIDPALAKHITNICLGTVDNIDSKYNITDRVLANKVHSNFQKFLMMYGASLSFVAGDNKQPGSREAFDKFSRLFFEQDTFKECIFKQN